MTQKTTLLPFWRQSRWQWVALIIIIVTVPVSAVAYLLLQQTERNLESQTFERLESVAALKLGSIEGFLDDGEGELIFLTETEIFRSQLIALAQSEADGQAISDTLRQIADSEDIINEIFVYSLDGNILSSSDRVDIGKVVRSKPFFVPSLQGETYIQPPFYDVGSSTLSLIISRPLFDEQGSLIAIVAVEMNVEALSELMTERAGLGESGETYLISLENNYLLTSSRFEGYETNRAYYSEGINRALQGQDGQGIYPDYRSPGVPVLGVYRWVPELQAALLSEIDEAEVNADLNDSVQQGILLALFLMVVALGVGLYFANSFTRPIIQMSAIAQRISGGDYSQRVQLRQKNEVGLLASSFNQMTEQLAATIQKLDAQVKEVETANQELRKANARVREAARLKSEFMATMSHELRTPLNAILGFTGIMLEGMGGEIDDDATHMIKRIQMNSERLLTLINDVLDIARIEAGRIELQSEPLRVRELLKQWELQTSVLAAQKQIQFSATVEPEVPEVLYGDSARLTQIVNNLLSNAFKFTEQGSVKLHISRLSSRWQIRVIDTGIGIPSHALNYIFDEFRQVDGSTTRAYGGSGLGLAITRNLCLMMGGTIQVESTLKQGSTFTVTLPIIAEPEKLLEPTP
ncbi:MAG: HAMP domain-containing protein [Anaerolineales bacterium]|nr:HAMP domain-containing protein [Anaerolineales bacterium]